MKVGGVPAGRAGRIGHGRDRDGMGRAPSAGTHIITGIAWIGSSFYFMHLDAAIKAIPDIPAGKGGEAWKWHGGGFYQVRKYLVAPDSLPKELMASM